MSGLKRALQWHCGWIHEHGSNQCGIVLSGGEFMNLPAFIMVKHLLMGLDRRSLCISQMALLCL